LSVPSPAAPGAAGPKSPASAAASASASAAAIPATGPATAVRIGRLDLRHPVLTASGTYGLGYEFAGVADLSRIGGVVGKTVTRAPRLGNAPPRTHETAGGMLNSIGLMNPGWDGFVRDTLPRIRELACPFVLNVAGEDEEDFVDLAHRANGLEGVAALELNLSCPNVAGGLDFSASPASAERVVSRCRSVYEGTLVAKLSPNVADVVPIARAAAAGGADAISLVNTYLGTAIDWRRRRSVFPRGVAGLSGPAIKPMALLAVARTARAVAVPVIGIGGIATADDVLEYLVAGATAVQIGTACFWNPAHPVRLADEVTRLLAAQGIADVRDLVGTLDRDAPTEGGRGGAGRPPGEAPRTAGARTAGR